MSVLVPDDKPPPSPRSSIAEKLDNEKQVYAVPVAEFDDPNIDFDAVGLEDDSPYPEVRSAVANTDDPDMPVNTIRAWCIGLCWSIILPGMNQFFFFRYPSITVTGVVAQLLSFPIGRLWARLMPRVKFFGMSLNPGPFTVKEHVLITIMATVGYSSAYATDIIAVQRVYYDQVYNFSYQWMVVMSTQLIGFSIGGICRRYLVQPPSMIWPTNLVTCALFNTLHSQQYVGMGNRAGISRERFFAYAFTASFCWYFFPGYIFQALSYFSWVCWIVPDNVVVNQLFGERRIRLRVFFWFVTPILYYTNTWYAKYMPMSSRTSYDNLGQAYNISRIITSTGTFNQTGYEHYSPLFLSTTFAISYGLSFASITSTIVHTVLYFRRQIWVQSRRSLSEQPDIHARLMNRYPQVPEWWYGAILGEWIGRHIVQLCIHAPRLSTGLTCLSAFIYTVPCGMIQAITNQQIALNVIAELIIGYALPGKPIAMMLFKTWGYYSMFQALQFTSDMKLGHYMKVPPRAMFWGQVIATLVAGTVQLGVQSWMFTNIPDICNLDQKDGFTCPSTQVFGTASFIWGVIGPARQFSNGQIYYGLVFFFIMGAVCPLVSYAISLKWPNSIFKYVNFPVIFNGSQWIPPASALNYVPWTIVGFIFNYVIRRRHFSWWTKYNYILSAAMDSGVAIAVLVIYFTLQYPANGSIGNGTIQSWWGNTVYKRTMDAQSVTYFNITGIKPFGPKHW
ncbi:OPT oligopeptide transporter [Fomitopsis serialis]|uniref:OPT oligopeptide transporter n=1 Tax=Fomitopsis serialis TaxID=139415 RepID=UPI0020084827|nr:OPT oligopeptide transporter [Neoantrodia serialis]KAH9917728.1 OPT oligopeptide transporter [Neoantrodia serialis]